MTLDAARLDAIRERLDKATPGPWFAPARNYAAFSEPDADLIANAPTDLADLLAAHEALTVELEQTKQIAAGYNDAITELHERLRLQTLRAEFAEKSEQSLAAQNKELFEQRRVWANNYGNVLEAVAAFIDRAPPRCHADDLKAAVLSTREPWDELTAQVATLHGALWSISTTPDAEWTDNDRSRVHNALADAAATAEAFKRQQRAIGASQALNSRRRLQLAQDDIEAAVADYKAELEREASA